MKNIKIYIQRNNILYHYFINNCLSYGKERGQFFGHQHSEMIFLRMWRWFSKLDQFHHEGACIHWIFIVHLIVFFFLFIWGTRFRVRSESYYMYIVARVSNVACESFLLIAVGSFLVDSDTHIWPPPQQQKHLSIIYN